MSNISNISNKFIEIGDLIKISSEFVYGYEVTRANRLEMSKGIIAIFLGESYINLSYDDTPNLFFYARYKLDNIRYTWKIVYVYNRFVEIERYINE